MIPSIHFPENHPTFTTERLNLKMPLLSDAESLFAMRSNNDFVKYLGRHPMKELSEAETYIKNIHEGFENKKGLSWKICETGSDELIGYMGFWEIDYNHYKTEIGYGLHPNFRGKGYMREALSIMVDYMLKTMNIHSIKADIDPLNIASRNLLLAVGFRKNAYVRENYFFDGKFIDSEYYGIIQSDLPISPA